MCVPASIAIKGVCTYEVLWSMTLCLSACTPYSLIVSPTTLPYDWDFRSASDFPRLTAPRQNTRWSSRNSTWLSTCNIIIKTIIRSTEKKKTRTDSWSCQEPVSDVKFRILECVQVRVGHLHILPLYLYLYLYSVFCTGQTIYHINYHDTIPVSCQLPRSTFSRISGSTDKTARDYGVHYHTEYRTAQSTK